MPVGSIAHDRFVTTRPDEGHTYLREVLYVDHHVRASRPADDFHFSSEMITVGETSLIRLQHTMPVDIDLPNGVARFTVCGSRRPGLAFENTDAALRVRPGVTAVIPTGIPYQCSWQALDSDSAQIDFAQLEDAAAASLSPDEQLQFGLSTNSARVAAEHWASTCRLVERIALANAHRGSNLLLVEELNRLIAEAALVCFPNNTHRGPETPSVQSGPPSLRRAVAFIESSADQTVTLADIASAARVSARSLNETFRRHLDKSPVAYLRQVRLDRAHHDLLAAIPGDGQTVSSIAARWGFGHLPRFSAGYRRSYGTAPSETLRRES